MPNLIGVQILSFMRKAVSVGIITGIFLSLVLIAGVYLMTTVQFKSVPLKLMVIPVIVSLATIALLIAMKQYNRNTEHDGWKKYMLTGSIATLTTAAIFSAASYIHTRFIDREYLSQLMERSRNLVQQNSSVQSITEQGENWFKTPFNFALNNFRMMSIVLFIITVLVSSIYHTVRKNRLHRLKYNSHPELIY
jgi:hypothetical protein